MRISSNNNNNTKNNAEIPETHNDKNNLIGSYLKNDTLIYRYITLKCLMCSIDIWYG